MFSALFRSFQKSLFFFMFLFSSAHFLWADTINAGDTAWVMISTALVFIMIPGLGFFYGGLVRKKNFLSILMQCFMALGFMSLQWACLGYSLSFGTDIAGFIGGLDFLFLKNVDSLALPSTGIPHNLFMAFQGMFAIITPAIIIGAFAERIKFLSFCLFSLIWGTLVYDSLAHWVWGGGFLHKMGTLDFAGGTVVHINAGIAALILTIMIGKRKGYPKHISSPHNLPFAVLGAALLWFGWFGFNAGSALAANGIASNAFVTTQIAAATSGCIWALIEWIRDKHPTMLGSITGAVAGLAAITPAAGFVSPMNAIWIGIGAAIICYIFVTIIKPKLGYDDTLDAFGIHGIGGIWGAIATGLWASTEVNSAGANGFFYGNPELLWIQFKATAVTILYIVPVTWIIAKLIDKTVGLRTSESSERIGLDLSEHRETAYTTLD